MSKHSKISIETIAKISLIRIGNDTVFFFLLDNVCNIRLKRNVLISPFMNIVLVTVFCGGNFTSLWQYIEYFTLIMTSGRNHYERISNHIRYELNWIVCHFHCISNIMGLSINDTSRQNFTFLTIYPSLLHLYTNLKNIHPIRSKQKIIPIRKIDFYLKIFLISHSFSIFPYHKQRMGSLVYSVVDFIAASAARPLQIK